MAISVRLTGRAARWVQLLQDFGHVDHDGADRLLVAVAELHAELGGADGAVVDLPLVKRAAAMLFAPQADEPMPLILEEDWPLLFS